MFSTTKVTLIPSARARTGPSVSRAGDTIRSVSLGYRPRLLYPQVAKGEWMTTIPDRGPPETNRDGRRGWHGRGRHQGSVVGSSESLSGIFWSAGWQAFATCRYRARGECMTDASRHVVVAPRSQPPRCQGAGREQNGKELPLKCVKGSARAPALWTMNFRNPQRKCPDGPLFPLLHCRDRQDRVNPMWKGGGHVSGRLSATAPIMSVANREFRRLQQKAAGFIEDPPSRVTMVQVPSRA
jgi:hypothetical protein